MEELVENDLVASVVPDPTSAEPDVKFLVGFLGRSPNPNYWRLYQKTTLDLFIEFHKNLVRHAVKIQRAGIDLDAIWLSSGRGPDGGGYEPPKIVSMRALNSSTVDDLCYSACWACTELGLPLECYVCVECMDPPTEVHRSVRRTEGHGSARR